MISSAYAQALPGTPLYTYARGKELIAPGLDGEEEYLLRISDTDAADEFSKLNFTDYPMLTVQSWRPMIRIETNYAFAKKYGLAQYRRSSNRMLVTRLRAKGEQVPEEPGFFGMLMKGRFREALVTHPYIAYHLRHLIPLGQFIKAAKLRGWPYAMGLLGEYLRFVTKGSIRDKFTHGYRSLRKIVHDDIPHRPEDPESMIPLREGR